MSIEIGLSESECFVFFLAIAEVLRESKREMTQATRGILCSYAWIIESRKRLIHCFWLLDW